MLYLRLNLNLIMEKGTVKFFNESKGYGFVISSKDESEYFVHVSKLIDELLGKKSGCTEGKGGSASIHSKKINM